MISSPLGNELAPSLKRGDVVVLDNLPAHKVVGIREAIADRGAQIFYLPPYSPDMDPIDMTSSKLKSLLRRGAGVNRRSPH